MHVLRERSGNVRFAKTALWLMMAVISVQVPALFAQENSVLNFQIEEGAVQVVGRTDSNSPWKILAWGFAVKDGPELWRIADGVEFPFRGELIYNIGEKYQFDEAQALSWLRNPKCPPKLVINPGHELKYDSYTFLDSDWPASADTRSFKVFDLLGTHVGYWLVRVYDGGVYEAMVLADSAKDIGFPLKKSVRAVPLTDSTVFGTSGSPKKKMVDRLLDDLGGTPLFAWRKWLPGPLSAELKVANVDHSGSIFQLFSAEIEEGPVDVMGRNGKLLAVGHRPRGAPHAEWWEYSKSLGLPFKDYVSMKFQGEPQYDTLAESGVYATARAGSIADVRTRVARPLIGSASDWSVTAFPSYTFLVQAWDAKTQKNVILGVYAHRQTAVSPKQVHVETGLLVAGGFPFGSDIDLVPLWEENSPDPLLAVAGADLWDALIQLLTDRGVVVPPVVTFKTFVATLD